MKLNLTLAALLLSVTLMRCSSSDSAEEAPSPKESAPASKTSSAPAAKSGDDEDVAAPAKPETRGKLSVVTTTLNNETGLEGSLPANVLSDSLMALDDLARKEPENIALLTTYLGLLRLHGSSPQSYDTYSRKGGAKGAKSFWFLIETGYGALKKKDYGLADYLFGKAEKLQGNTPQMKAAVQHAYGIRHLMMGKTQTGIAAMRKAAETQPPYLPSLLTLGFLGLKSGDIVGAERIFRSASSTFPSSINARIGLAAALRGRGKGEEAATILGPLYKSHGQERRVSWNYALVLADDPAKSKEAQEILTKYFQLPGSVPEIDTKANQLITKLQRPTPAPTAVPKPSTPAPAPAAAKPAATPAPAAAKAAPAAAKPAAAGAATPAASESESE